MRAAEGEEFDDLRVWIGEEPASRRALSVSSRTVVDRDGRVSGAVLAYHDVTDLVRAMQVKDIGGLSPGMWADFVVLERDPRADIRHTRSIASVWVAGKSLR